MGGRNVRPNPHPPKPGPAAGPCRRTCGGGTPDGFGLIQPKPTARRILADVDPHRLAELRSLALHRAVAERVRRDPAVVERARRTVARWLSEERSPYYARAWAEILSSPVARICEVLVADDEWSRALRQATPFAGVIEPKERWRIWREARSSHEAT